MILLMCFVVTFVAGAIGWAIGMKTAAELLSNAVGEIAARTAVELERAEGLEDLMHKEEWYEGCIWALKEVKALYADEE